jgi:hypothetical protein
VTFAEFLIQAKQKSFFDQQPMVICFYGEEYQPLFFRALINFLKENKIVSITSLNVPDRKQLWEALQQCFLGETSFYWLGDVLEGLKSKKNESDLVEILSLYRGPHSVAFFVNRDNQLSVSVKKRLVMVDLQKKVGFEEAIKIISFFGIQISQGKRMVLHDICEQSDGIYLDSLCMLINYFAVTSSKVDDSLKEHLENIAVPEKSLFALSQAFFKKQKEQFFAHWLQCQDDYTIPFWVTYWSEQIWQAYCVVTFLKQNDFAMAKRFSYRLPYSFIKYDWQLCSLPQLKRSYEMLYEIDYKFKRGSTFCALDFFYHSYFSNKI